MSALPEKREAGLRANVRFTMVSRGVSPQFPVAFGIYAFPTDLQIHINGFVCSIWILMCLQLGKRSGK